MRKETKKIYQNALDAWGLNLQLLMAIEEATELTHSVCKLIRDNDSIALEKVADEIADNKIMIEQLEFVLNLQKEVRKRRERKLRRLKKRIKTFNDYVRGK